ncbi:hypothetical protein LNQ49_16985 [Flavobacterium sp. F-65]|uniref:Apea-like HEPN domain-containing protein n=1 Tax=Flavobacterium pisciphilum TaxID=2893755 RepID=A0ABS8MZJ7_9FLAO|nr:hypothetical protein [Flavobacterium sp. F-65]MCC9073275.1 hypothetical protein [Flavobacterium sp. F-65]
MRKFVEKKGKYVIKLPEDWFHKNALYDAKESDPNSFELVEESVGTFQINVIDIAKGKIPDLIKNNNIQNQEYGKSNLDIVERFIEMDKFGMYMWFVRVEDNFVISKYIYDVERKNDEKVKLEIEKAKESLKSLIFVPAEIREQILIHYQFDKFMFSLASAGDLISRAYKSTNPIELVILLANQIDALLRLCLILHNQIETKTKEIDIKLISQRDEDKVVMEKSIYKMTFEKGIITKELHDELHNLYNKRNKVVHRYIISDLTTKDVYEISIDYSLMEKKIGDIVKFYEKEQHDKKIGMYGKGDSPSRAMTQDERTILQLMIDEKHSHYSFITKEK